MLGWNGTEVKTVIDYWCLLWAQDSQDKLVCCVWAISSAWCVWMGLSCFVETEGLEFKQYKDASFYYALLYCTLQILHFLQTEVLQQSCAKHNSQCWFSNSICSLHVSHFINSCNISNICTITIFIVEICDQCYYYKRISDDSIFYQRIFLIRIYALFFYTWCHCTHNSLQFSSV